MQIVLNADILLERFVWNKQKFEDTFLTTVLIDPNVSFNQVFSVEQLKGQCLLFHCDIIPAVSLVLPLVM